MSLYWKIDAEVMDACYRYREGRMNSSEFSYLCEICSSRLGSLEDRELEDMLSRVEGRYWSILWYLEDDRDLFYEEEQEVREAILPYVDCIEKLIIRGNNSNDSHITEEERAEWWKKQKEKEDFSSLEDQLDEYLRIGEEIIAEKQKNQ